MPSTAPAPTPLRVALVACALLLAAGVPVARAASTVERIVVVSSGEAALYREVSAGIAAGLASSSGDPTPLRIEQTGLAELEADDVTGPRGATSLFVAVGTPAARWLVDHLEDGTPMVYVFASAFELPHLRSRAATAGIGAEVSIADQLATVRRAMPEAEELRIGMLFDARDAASAARRDALQESQPEGWSLVAVDVGSHASAAEAVAELVQARPGLVWTAPDRSALPKATFVHLLRETLEAGIPVFGYAHACVRSGAAFGVGYPLSEQTTTAVELVRMLLDEPAAEDPRDLHRHPRPEVSVNRFSAERLGLPLLDPVLMLATHVFPPEED